MKRLFAAVLLLSGCALNEVPPEVGVAIQAQDQAWAGAAANYKTVILAYDKELRAAYDAHLLSVLEARVRAESQPSAEAFLALVNEAEAHRKRVAADLDRKRDEFLAEENLVLGPKLNAIAGEYVRHLSETQERINKVIAEIKGAVQ